MIRKLALAAASSLAALLLVAAAHAQDAAPATPSAPIGVVVRGRATAPADTLELELTVAATGDASKDSAKKLRTTVAKVIAALERPPAVEHRRSKDAPDSEKKSRPHPAVDDDDDDDAPAEKGKADAPAKPSDDAKPSGPDEAEAAAAIPVEVSERDLELGGKPPAAAGLEGQPKPEATGIRFSSKVVATIRKLATFAPGAVSRRVASLIDAAVDAGADGTDGVAPVVRLLVEDPEKLHALAYKDAIDRARARASTLAELSGRKLGRVVSAREAPAVIADAPDPTSRLVLGGSFAVADRDAGRAPSPRLLGVTQEVELLVEFDLAP